MACRDNRMCLDRVVGRLRRSRNNRPRNDDVELGLGADEERPRIVPLWRRYFTWFRTVALFRSFFVRLRCRSSSPRRELTVRYNARASRSVPPVPNIIREHRPRGIQEMRIFENYIDPTYPGSSRHHDYHIHDSSCPLSKEYKYYAYHPWKEKYAPSTEHYDSLDEGYILWNQRNNPWKFKYDPTNIYYNPVNDNDFPSRRFNAPLEDLHQPFCNSPVRTQPRKRPSKQMSNTSCETGSVYSDESVKSNDNGTETVTETSGRLIMSLSDIDKLSIEANRFTDETALTCARSTQVCEEYFDQSDIINAISEETDLLTESEKTYFDDEDSENSETSCDISDGYMGGSEKSYEDDSRNEW